MTRKTEGSRRGDQDWPTDIETMPLDLAVRGKGLHSERDYLAAQSRMPSEGGAHILVKHPKFPDWGFIVTFSDSGQPVGLEARCLRGFPFPGERPVTARLLRAVPIGEIQDAARRGLLEHVDGLARYSPDFGELPAHWHKALADAPRPGRAGRGDLAFAQVAAAYVNKVNSAGSSGTPVRALAVELGLSPSRVRNLLYTARKKGMLTNAQAGKAGGELTPKARKLLQADAKERE